MPTSSIRSESERKDVVTSQLHLSIAYVQYAADRQIGRLKIMHYYLSQGHQTWCHQLKGLEGCVKVNEKGVTH